MSDLQTAFQAAQARQASVSTNPIGLSAHLTRQAQNLPEIDFAAETSAAISNLEDAVVEYQSKEGKPNLPLIEAKQAVVLLQAKLEEARR